MKIWTPEQEAENLANRFETVNRAAFAREHGIKGGGAMIYQHMTGRRPMNLQAALAYAKGLGCKLDEISPRLAKEALAASSQTSSNVGQGKLKSAGTIVAIDDASDDDRAVQIRRVLLRVSAGIAGFATDEVVEDDNPIFFRRRWFDSRGFDPAKLIAMKVKGDSMETRLYEGDTVVINTAQTNPVDGEIFAVNYEGEAVIKRLVREMGFWWLVSDNQDQRRFPKKRCQDAGCIVIGRMVLSQTERG